MYAKPNIVAFGTKCLYSRGLFYILVSFFIFCSSSEASAQWGGNEQQRTNIAFWNVENLYDTIPSPFYDDSEYTPRGARRWNTERYRAKLTNLARVLDDISADIVGLAEVENEAVVRDLVMTLGTDYNYIHRTSGDSRGIDVALLYKGDRFFPDTDSTGNLTGVRLVRSGTGREFLHVPGELMVDESEGRGGIGGNSGKAADSERVHILVCHLASNLNSAEYRRRNMAALRVELERLLAQDPAANIVVMGDMNATPDDRLVRKTLGDVASPLNFMYTPHHEHRRAGWGSYNYRGRWYLYDWMMLSPASVRSGRLRVKGWIYAKEYLTEPATAAAQWVRRPLRTFYGGDYLGGFSDHFPVGISIVN